LTVSTRTTARRIVRSLLATDFACDERDLSGEGVKVVPSEERPGRRRYPVSPDPFSMVTMGSGVVVSCGPERIDRMKSMFGPLDRDLAFSPKVLAEVVALFARENRQVVGPCLVYACSEKDLRPAAPPAETSIEIVFEALIKDLFVYEGFRHALSYRHDSPRPEKLAAVARTNGEIVGIAAASVDCESMWQIGVDFLESARGRNIGRALVSRLADSILKAGKLPYYAAAPTNVNSNNVAVSAGFWLAWTEVFIKGGIA